LSKSCQKVAKKLQKIVKKLSKSCQKVVKKLQKVDKRSCHVSLVILCDTGSHFKKKSTKGAGGENSSSKAFGISFADRPKAKMGAYLILFSQNMTPNEAISQKAYVL
jgi:hypothetical protein